MIRMPPYLDNCTSSFPRTTRCDGRAIYRYKSPLHRRFFYACVRHGWAIAPAVLAVLVLTGCDDVATAKLVADDAASTPLEAHRQARREWLEQFAEVKP